MEHLDEFFIAFENSFCNLSQACKDVGISLTYVYQYAEENPEFAKKMWETYQGFLDLAESSLLKLGVAGEGASLKTFLNARAKDRGYGSEAVTHNFLDDSKIQKEQKEFKKSAQELSAKEIKKLMCEIKKVRI